MIQRFWRGEKIIDIARALGYTEVQVGNIVRSAESQEILQQLQDATLDSMEEVATELQLAAPLAVKKKIDLMSCGDSAVENRAATDVLHMAGHAPVRRVQVSRSESIAKRYEDKTEDELRAMLASELGLTEPPPSPVGPDGRPLN